MQRMPDADYHGFQTMAMFEPGVGIRGVALFHNYRKTDIEIVFAGEGNWARRDVITKILTYPFRQLGCRRITALVRKDNRKSRKMVQQIGFKQEGKLRAANPDGTDLFVYGLLPSDYRLFRKPRVNDGQIDTESAAAA
ncbi:MAG: GNAT family N-acetyltransferase [Gammaproteobacteria bacterium]|nr:GNAT family N-acetyltransferase [Gammaproteobacteria bacterium]